MGYYGLNDEGILILQNDIFRAGQRPKVSAAMVRDHVSKLIRGVDSAAADRQLSTEQVDELRIERDGLLQIFGYFTQRAEEEEAKDALERKQAEERQSRAKLAALRAQSARQEPSVTPKRAPTTGPTLLQAPPSPTTAPRGPVGADPFNLSSGAGQTMAPFDQCIAVAQWLEDQKDEFVRRADPIRNGGSQAEGATEYRQALREWLARLNMITDAWEKKGRPEWPGVQRMRRLQDQLKNELRNRLMIGEL